jgi:putative membrane protein
MRREVTLNFTRILEQAGLCVVLVVAPAAAGPQNGVQSPSASTVSPGDRTFLNQAVDGGMAEVELGRLALQKAADTAVKRFGQRMIDEHSKANDALRQLAAREGVDLPKAPSERNRDWKRRLAGLSGSSFDRAYMSDMVTDHEEEVAAFQRESNWARDPQVKSFATRCLPALREQLKNAQEISAKTTSALARAPVQTSSAKPSPSKLASSKPGGGKASLLR